MGKQDLVDIYEVRYWKHDNDKEDFFSVKDFGYFRIYIRSQARQTNRNAK